MKWALIFLFLMLADSAAAVGIGVSPDKLTYSGSEGELIQRQFTIYNPSDSEIFFSISADEIFSFSESRFLIDAGGSRKITATAKIPEKSQSSKVSILAKNGAGGIALNTAVAIGAELLVEEEEKGMKKVIGPVISASIVGVGLAAYAAISGKRE
ncbi:hypothetical protein JXB11_00650 [Candidatus Woesearchaeota archaeon]|nr:hypothetical protein [Candidatus Woesearchaeota archaeon]